MTQTERESVYEKMTNRIISLLQVGVVPWSKPWKGGLAGAMRSYATNKAYRGFNQMFLCATAAAEGFQSKYWITFNQAKKLGGNIKKGAHGTPVIFWKFIIKDVKDEATGKVSQKKIGFLKYFTLFNIDQTENVKGKPGDLPVEPMAEFTPIEAAEAIVQGFKNKPQMVPGGNAAFYRPSTDEVGMPAKESFKTAEHFYSTLFHEFGHSTGHKSRLDRSGVAQVTFFGSDDYSKEELVAEMTACYLCGVANIDKVTEQESAAYCQSWIKTLKGDSKLIIMAASQAQKAADHILGTKPQAETEAESSEQE